VIHGLAGIGLQIDRKMPEQGAVRDCVALRQQGHEADTIEYFPFGNQQSRHFEKSRKKVSSNDGTVQLESDSTLPGQRTTSDSRMLPSK
jgi:hypothetical protein